MSSSTFAGNSDGLVTGLCPAPPPPPPPPPAPGQVPAMRINTAEAPAIKRPQIVNNDGYEPPAAIQNAMLTKDKKPFTYTPGMGGKLDLSQIRSPRMARRVAKNANDEGIEGPPKSALEPKPTPAQNAPANLFVQPQVAVPVFPTNVPPQAPASRTPPTPPISRTLSNASEKQAEPARSVTKAETKVTPITVTPVQPSSPESPSTPTQVTLTKAPTPWLQNKNKPQEELPEWAKRASANKQSSSPDSPTSPPVYAQIQQTPQPQWQQAQPKQQPIQQRQPAQQYQYQQQQQQQPQMYQPPPQQPQQYQQQQQQQQKRPYSTPTMPQQTSQQERVIPIRIEDRPSVFDVKQDSGHHQFKQPSSHHQQRWGQGQAPNQGPTQPQPSTPSGQPQQTTGGAYIIPIMVESNDKRPTSMPASNVTYVQPAGRNNVAENQSTRVVQQRGPPAAQQVEPGPVQSRSFRVLQKITDTDVPNDVDPEQIRKLQLTEDDRVLMNKFKEQVDGDTYLHQEEDPRYRGAAIPSRAFRFLQNMTDSGEAPVQSATPRAPSAINKKQNRNSKSFEESQANLPPSEQQVQEPKKYMGSAIPSRSFRILQAMTAPESVATQENRQADYTCQTENNVPGNQQGVYFPPCPPPFWSPESGWWGCYPLPYAGVAGDAKPFDPYSYHHDGTAYVYYPIYNQSYPPYAQCNPANGESGVYANPHPQYLATAATAPWNQSSSVNHAYDRENNNDAMLKDQQLASVTENRLQEHESKITNDAALHPSPQWSKPGNVSRAGSSNSNKDSDCTTAMNITDEEEIPEALTATENDEGTCGHDNLDANSCPAAGLKLNVPNYTYIDTSDSSDSTDSESHSDNESLIESSKSNSSNDTTSNNTSSDTEDSDSYLAYSTGLNPHGRYEKDNERNAPRVCADKESREDRDESESSSEKICSDRVSASEDQAEQDAERSKNDATFPHQLSVIYEDVEHADSESPRPLDGGSNRRWDEVPLEATDDPPDEADTTTVSVSLPLRFKFSVSENNEDVTTVIVGDSTIKPERPVGKDDRRTPQVPEQRSQEKCNDVSADYQVSSDTTVDFTIKRHSADSKRKVRNHACERIREETTESKVEKVEEPVTPHVNFTLRKNQSRVGKINCEETVETEFTIKSKKFVEKARVEKGHSEPSVNAKTSMSDLTMELTDKEVAKEESISLTSTKNYDATVKVTQKNYELHDFNKNVVNPEVVVSECASTEDSRPTPSEGLLRTEPPTTKIPAHQEDVFAAKRSNEEDREADVEDKSGKERKHLLSVQNSREETDDEDSGVTSDMSRIISEVDTDSECAPTRNIRKYQRTQTHSRLFRLLNDDSVLPESTETTNDSASRREYLSLPLKPSTFTYDENYCSNYSSGLTSPEYSPICEQSWRRLHDAETSAQRAEQNGDARQCHHILGHQERVSCKEDPYYQAWKAPKPATGTEQDVLPSLAFKALESKKPFWAYKVNVLCPRIRSAKNVPQVLQVNRTNESSVPPIPASCHANPKREHC